MNFLKGTVTAIKDGVASIQCAARAILQAGVLPGRLSVGDSVTVGIRPEHLQASGSGAGLSGHVDVIERLGNLSLLYITLDSGEQVIAESREESLNGARIEVGKAIHLEPSLAAIHVFDKSEQSVTDHARRAAPTQEAA
jgi:ABC-type sugar transport system ATPase subunit